jgi:hypothetical protein
MKDHHFKDTPVAVFCLKVSGVGGCFFKCWEMYIMVYTTDDKRPLGIEKYNEVPRN